MAACVSAAARAAHHGADVQRAAVCARTQRGAPRHQAGEHHADGDDTVKVTDFGTAKILAVRHRAADRARDGHAELHVAGTGEGPRSRRTQRYFLPGRDAVRNDHGREAVSRSEHHHGHLQDRERRAGAAAADRSIDSSRDQRGGDEGAGEGTGRRATRAAGKCSRICGITAVSPQAEVPIRRW